MEANGESERGRELIEFEKELADWKAKKSEGPKLFRQLQEYLFKELHDANRRGRKNEYVVKYLRSGPFKLFRYEHVRVQRRDRKTPPLMITYSPAIHHMHFECGERNRDFTLIRGDNGVLWFDISAQIGRTIQEVVAEVLTEIEPDNVTHIPSLTGAVDEIPDCSSQRWS